MSTNNTLSINLLGFGRVGKALLKLLQPATGITITAIYNRTPCPECTSDLTSLPQAELNLLAVSDDAISEVATQLLLTQKNACFIHFSGALPASICNPQHRQDIHCASLHPPISFPSNPEKAALLFASALCTLEGDPIAVAQTNALFARLNISMITIDPAQKATYHAACVMASNYLVTLAENAKTLFEQASIETDAAKLMTEQLIKSSISQLVQHKDYRNALTGPLKRGDTDTIQKHLQQLPLEKQALYRALGLQTLSLTHLPSETVSSLTELLNDGS